MGVKASTVIAIAQSWIGKNSRDGSHKSIIDLYNSQPVLPRNYKVQYTDQWCATFVTALFVEAGDTSIMFPECGCEKMIEGANRMGIFIEDENRVPNVGDLILYDWEDTGIGDCKGWADHVGIVEYVNGKLIGVIEGNSNNSVARTSRTVNQRKIRGYIVPRYENEHEITESKQKQIIDYGVVATDVICGKYGNGNERRNKLQSAGYDYATVQSLVNYMATKLKVR